MSLPSQTGPRSLPTGKKVTNNNRNSYCDSVHPGCPFYSNPDSLFDQERESSERIICIQGEGTPERIDIETDFDSGVG